jgi:hypothetical protein
MEKGECGEGGKNKVKSGINNRISITRQSVVIIIFQDKQPTPLHNNSVTS